MSSTGIMIEWRLIFSIFIEKLVRFADLVAFSGMRILILTLLTVLWMTGVTAGGRTRGDFGFSLGDGKLYESNGTDFGLSMNINGHLNYINGVFLADVGLGAVLINDRRESAYGSVASSTELFAELPVGLGLIFDVGGANIVVGTDLALLLNPGGAGTYTVLSPHVDILWDNKRNGRNNGLFAKGMYHFGNKDRYEPRYFGIGYRIMLPAKKRAVKGKNGPVPGRSV